MKPLSRWAESAEASIAETIVKFGQILLTRKVGGSRLASVAPFAAAFLLSACSDPYTPPESPASQKVSETGGVPAPDNAAGGWRVSRDHDPMDGSTTVSLQLSAVEQPRFFPPPRQLVVRCRRNKTDVIVVTHEPVESSYESWNDLSRTKVRYKLDGKTAVTEIWSESSDFAAIFSRHPIAFAKALAGGREMLFEYSPHGSIERTLRFNVSGFANVLPEVASSCNWKFEPPTASVPVKVN